MRFFSFIITIMVLLGGCGNSDSYTPKPRAYPRVEYPEKVMTAFSQEACPFSFKYPDYVEVRFQYVKSGEEGQHPCWFDLYVEAFDARIHCTYSAIASQGDFQDLIDDSFTIANKINLRSQYMDEIRVQNANGVGGLIMEFTGPAASPMQFFLTDTTLHFFRGALYFNTQARPDSLAPITEFLKADIATIINTFNWE